MELLGVRGGGMYSQVGQPVADINSVLVDGENAMKGAGREVRRQKL